MLSLFLLSAVLVALCGGDALDDAAALASKCGKEFKITENVMADLKHAHLDDMKPSDDLKCFTKCIFTELGLVKDKKIIGDKVKELYAVVALTQDVTPTIAALNEKCQKMFKGEETCDEAWNVFKCYLAYENK